jgi:hypothetical protein
MPLLIAAPRRIWQKVCGIGKFDDQPGAREPWAKTSQPWQTEKIESVISLFGSSSIFLKRYRQELARDERVTVILNAALLHFEMDPLSRAITSAQAAPRMAGSSESEPRPLYLLPAAWKTVAFYCFRIPCSPAGSATSTIWSDAVSWITRRSGWACSLHPPEQYLNKPAFMISTITEGKP